MKRFLQKTAAVLAVLTLVLTLVPVTEARAADQPQSNLTISTTTDDTHTYDVYQIFTGRISEDGTRLSNIKTGANYKGAADEASVKAAVQALENVKDAADDRTKLGVIETYVDFATTAVATVDKDTTASVTPGYYLIRDKESGSVGAYDSYTLYIVKVAGDVTIQRKTAVPTVSKKTKEVNDSAGTTSDWQNYGDYDIGDEIEFQLTGTMPDNYGIYTSYQYIFHDTLSKGLTYKQDSVSVSAGGTTLAADQYTVTPAAQSDGTTKLDIRIADTKKIAAVTKDSAIFVTYKAVLGTDAVKGSTGNSNKVTLEFSNNPNTGKENSTAVTPESEVNIYTYRFTINKTDKNHNPVNGAGFTLSKKLNDGTYQIIGTEQVNTTGNTFTWEGLDAGEYKLEETTTPDRYNTMKPVEFQIESAFDTTDDHLQTLTGTITADADSSVNHGTDHAAGLASDVTTGTISGNVINIEGAILPTTGTTGIIILAVAAIVVLLTAGVIRRKAKKE